MNISVRLARALRPELVEIRHPIPRYTIVPSLAAPFCYYELVDLWRETSHSLSARTAEAAYAEAMSEFDLTADELA